jgi:hypothetical protein
MMTDIGLITIFVLALVGMTLAIFGVFPPQVDLSEHDDPPEERE